MRSRARHGWTAQSSVRMVCTLFLCLNAKAIAQSDGPASPQIEGPPAPNESPSLLDETADEDSPPVKSFSLHARELSLDLEGSYQDRRVRSGGTRRTDSTQRNRDFRFDESVNLHLDGHLWDPRIIRWDASMRLGLAQEDSREEFNGVGRDDRDSGALVEYDLALDFLPDRPFSGHAYARRARDRIPRRFLPSLLEERSEAGAAAFWSDGIWNGQLSFDWSDIDRTGNSAEDDDEHLENTRLSLENKWEINDRHQLRVVYDHEREESEYTGSRGDFDTSRDQLRVEHDFAFGREGRHRLNTYFRYNDEKGDLARDELEAVTRLSLRHTDTFETAYRYSAYRVEQDAIEVTRHKGDFEATFKPNDRLRISFDTFALRETVDQDIETHEFGGGIDVSYRHPTAKGEFRGDFSFQADQSRTVGDAGDGVVLGEAHVLDSVRPAVLRQADVQRFTIRALNVARNRLYIEGRDYRVVNTGRLTSVYRILSGRIVEGEAVSFDYQYRIPAGSRIDTYRTDLRLEHAFTWGWTPYYALDLRRQDANGSTAVPAFEDNTERHRFGVRLDRKVWSGGVEYEIVHDTVEPYDAVHLDARIALLRQATHELDTSARFSVYDFDGDRARNVKWFEVDATDRYRFTPHLSSTLKAAYRWEDNSLDGLTEGVDLEGGLEYERGALHVELIVEYDALDIDDSRDRGYGVWLNIRRDLTHLVAKGSRQ